MKVDGTTSKNNIGGITLKFPNVELWIFNSALYLNVRHIRVSKIICKIT